MSKSNNNFTVSKRAFNDYDLAFLVSEEEEVVVSSAKEGAQGGTAVEGDALLNLKMGTGSK